MIELAVDTGQLPAVDSDKVSTAIATITSANVTFTDLRQRALELADKYRAVVWDVSTGKGMEDACKARAELREVRYEMQKLQTGGKRMLNDLKRDFDGRAEELIQEVERAETPIDQIIKAGEEKKAAERVAREQAEAARRERHAQNVAAFAAYVAEAAGADSAGIALVIESVTALEVTDAWEEYKAQGQQARDEALRQLNGMLIAALADEADRAELEALRRANREREAQNAAQTAELQRREREVAEREQRAQAAEAEAEFARLARQVAIQQRLDLMNDLVTAAHQAVAAADVKQLMSQLPDHATITHDLYGDREAEAMSLRVEAGSRVLALYEAALQREQAAARQQVIDHIEALGSGTEQYDSEEIRARMRLLDQVRCDPVPMGPQFEEAVYERDVARTNLDESLAAALVREEAQRQEAAAKAARDAEEAAQRAKGQRILERAARMYALLERLLECKSLLEATDGFDWLITDEAAQIINEVEGEEHA